MNGNSESISEIVKFLNEGVTGTTPVGKICFFDSLKPKTCHIP